MNKQLSYELVRLLIQKDMTIAQAESCTGGLLSKYITDQPGASGIFECGIVSYSGRIKNQLLGVCDKTLAAYGEVSAQTAEEMAVGIRRVAKSTIGIGITGIAGPGGGSPEKPVGLVYFAVAFGDECQSVRLELFDCKDRNEVREKTVENVLKFVINKIKNSTV